MAGQRNEDPPDNNDGTAEDGTEKASDAQPSAGNVGTEPKGWSAEEKAHKAAERDYWIHQKWINKITLTKSRSVLSRPL